MRGTTTSGVKTLRHLLNADASIFISGCIYQEVLQGERDQASFERLRQYFGALPFCAPATDETHAEAALLYARLRWVGITIRSANDALIAQQAIDGNLVLVHDDEVDFLALGRVAPQLMLAT